jgi:hypothetical protein
MPKVSTNPNLVISYHRMRMLVGILGISLPFTLLIGNTIINELGLLNNDSLVLRDCQCFYHPFSNFKDSISDYYYTTVGELFVGTLCAVAFFMFSYRGYPKKAGELMPSDSFMTNLAGICALGVAIFPTSQTSCLSDNLRTFISSTSIGYIHYSFATVFFVSLSIMSLVNFRRTYAVEKFGTMPSHNFYKYCGIGILVSIAIIALYSFTPLHETLKNIPVVFIFETTSLLFFGASWIKKGLIDSN